MQLPGVANDIVRMTLVSGCKFTSHHCPCYQITDKILRKKKGRDGHAHLCFIRTKMKESYRFPASRVI